MTYHEKLDAIMLELDWQKSQIAKTGMPGAPEEQLMTVACFYKLIDNVKQIILK